MSIVKHFLNKQFLLFIVVGCINTFNGVLFAGLYNLFMPPTIAFVLGYICSLVVSYLLNSHFVFKKDYQLSRFLKFCVSYIPNFIIQFICVLIIINLLQWYPLIAYTIAAVIGVPITFLFMKLFAFNN